MKGMGILLPPALAKLLDGTDSWQSLKIQREAKLAEKQALPRQLSPLKSKDEAFKGPLLPSRRRLRPSTRGLEASSRSRPSPALPFSFESSIQPVQTSQVLSLDPEALVPHAPLGERTGRPAPLRTAKLAATSSALALSFSWRTQVETVPQSTTLAADVYRAVLPGLRVKPQKPTGPPGTRKPKHGLNISEEELAGMLNPVIEDALAAHFCELKQENEVFNVQAEDDAGEDACEDAGDEASDDMDSEPEDVRTQELKEKIRSQLLASMLNSSLTWIISKACQPDDEEQLEMRLLARDRLMSSFEDGSLETVLHEVGKHSFC